MGGPWSEELPVLYSDGFLLVSIHTMRTEFSFPQHFGILLFVKVVQWRTYWSAIMEGKNAEGSLKFELWFKYSVLKEKIVLRSLSIGYPSIV